MHEKYSLVKLLYMHCINIFKKVAWLLPQKLYKLSESHDYCFNLESIHNNSYLIKLLLPIGLHTNQIHSMMRLNKTAEH